MIINLRVSSFEISDYFELQVYIFVSSNTFLLWRTDIIQLLAQNCSSPYSEQVSEELVQHEFHFSLIIDQETSLFVLNRSLDSKVFVYVP